MLSKKVIIAIVVASLVLYGYECWNGEESKQGPNVLLGLTLLGAFGVAQTIKEFTQII